MKAIDVFIPTRRGNFYIPELDKAYLGTFDPKVGLTGGGAAPRGTRPGEVKPLGKTPEESEERARKMGMPTAVAEHSMKVTAQKPVAAPQPGARVPFGEGTIFGSKQQVHPASPGPVAMTRMPAAGQQAKQVAEKAMAFKAYQGTFDPQVGFTGEGVAPKGYRPGKGQVVSGEEAEKMGEDPRVKTYFRLADSASKAVKEKVVGGIGDGKPDSEFDPEQLAAGMKVEREHTKDEATAREIAKDHLTEDKDYYKKLKKMEGANKVEKSLSMLDDLNKASTAMVKRAGTQPAKHTGFSMTTPARTGGYSMSSTAPSAVGQPSAASRPKREAIDAEFREVSSKPAAGLGAGASAPKMLSAAGAPSASASESPAEVAAAKEGGGRKGGGGKKEGGGKKGGGGRKTKAAPTATAAAPPPTPTASAGSGKLPPPSWPKPGAPLATGASIVPKMGTTTGGPGTLHPGPTAPEAGSGAGSAGPGKPGAGAGGAKAAKQKVKKLPGSAFGEGMGIGGMAASDTGSAASGVAPLQTLAQTLGQKADVRAWRSAGVVPAQAGEVGRAGGTQNLGRSGQLRTPSLRMSMSKANSIIYPMLYLRKGI